MHEVNEGGNVSEGESSRRDKVGYLQYNVAMNTEDNLVVNNEDIEAFTVSSEGEEGLSVNLEAIKDPSDPATEGVGD